jgi:hypothetical protein
MCKSTTLMATILLLGMAGSAATQNSSDVDQQNDGNSATVEQTFGPAAIARPGAGNISEITQIRSGGTEGNRAHVKQTISNSTIAGPIGFGDRNGSVNSSKITQEGSNNDADVTQTATGSGDNGLDTTPPPYGSRINQTGHDNTATMEQRTKSLPRYSRRPGGARGGSAEDAG